MSKPKPPAGPPTIGKVQSEPVSSGLSVQNRERALLGNPSASGGHRNISAELAQWRHDCMAAISHAVGMEEERDIARAEVAGLKERIGIKYPVTDMCRDGHNLVLYDGGDWLDCPMCSLRARVEFLEGLIVDVWKPDAMQRDHDAMTAEYLAIKAAREKALNTPKARE